MIQYFPVTLPLLLILGGLLLMLLFMVALDVLSYAYIKMGIAPRYVLAVLFLSLVGSYINIPIMRFPQVQVVSEQEVIYFGIRYVMPVVRDWPGTVVAINVGGAVVPVLTSVYLLIKNRLWVRGFLGTAIIAAICHALAHPVPGMGIAIPIFVPPLVTTAVALILSQRQVAPLAYISGSLGTLIGADLLNLGSIHGLGTPIASIGGAGTFDGIFVTGLLAVLFASIATAFDRRRGAS
jgi:uncharacterized membrane protein